MKNALIIAALGIAMSGGVTVGYSQTGAGAANTESSQGFVDFYNAQSAMETGALPWRHGNRVGNAGNPSNDQIASIVEPGGVKFRVGLDTGP